MEDSFLSIGGKIFAIPLLRALRPFSFLSLFLNNLELYSYDNCSYFGTLKTVLESMNYLQKVKWTLITYFELLGIDDSLIDDS